MPTTTIRDYQVSTSTFLRFTSRGREQQLEEQLSCQWEGQAGASARHWQINLVWYLRGRGWRKALGQVTATCQPEVPLRLRVGLGVAVYPGSLSLSRLQAGPGSESDPGAWSL
jgi:hypothetical protein